ncbi:MAG: hypothetical protein WAU12_07465 [Saprospiraceae bacterium]|jgi:hypothetical protein|uniref:hypothetical protein n=1 Tax=Candidatus Brachybacter algidus TaxID=2982024 RepID=UPI001B3FDC7A|nr:hypothetical protein [Candidatus Brachybacter algidus]MBP7305568.1 hypothetical protein [Saprospiraceae bacterium]MBK6374351.1 hypothetical protein [Candidatus Brachybacter algidus]MBK6450675.1 hypothetical protein [Candidatus Brachybacter algidus]MBK7604775.1 hypothetical protein [Candidatus Brachybacter algidus]MBK8603609.1 hypothetical protein [Candidatus Brachybacter algidus]
MNIRTIFLIPISLIIFGCSNVANEHSTNESQIIVTAEHHHNEESIGLNNGNKWKVDTNMMTHIRNMEMDINTLEVKNTKEYAELAIKFEHNIELLTSNCTMEGQAHDELHKWLLPYIDLSSEFSECKTLDKYAEIFQKIKSSFITFNTYFE